MLLRNLLPIALLVAAALSSWWLYQQVQPSQAIVPTNTGHEPDYFFENFIVTSMNAAGQPKHRLKGSKMAHFPDDDTTELEQPELEFYNDNKSDWTINAERGWISSKGEQLRLEGAVEIERQTDGEDVMIRAVTRDLLVKPNEKYAETEHPVIITRGGMQVKAVGMRAFIAEGRLQLLSKVEGTYAPR